MISQNFEVCSNIRRNIKNKTQSASFTSLEVNDSFNHYRSVSYIEAISNLSTSASYKSGINSLYPSDHNLEQRHKISSLSTPCTPKKIEVKKYSTLPTSIVQGLAPTKKSRSSSLSNIFKKLKPKFHKSSSDVKNPWIVIEFSHHSIDKLSCNESDESDHSFELAAKSKEQHFTSLKDLQGSLDNDTCKCLSSSNKMKRKSDESTSLKCNYLNVLNMDNRNDNYKKCQSNIKQSKKHVSHRSILSRLSPRKPFEDFKQTLKGFTKRNKLKTCSSLHSFQKQGITSKSNECLKVQDQKTNKGSSGCISQVLLNQPACVEKRLHEYKVCRWELLNNGKSSIFIPPTAKAAVLMNDSKPLLERNCFLKVPCSTSENAALLYTPEISSRSRRAQPPKTLSLTNRAFSNNSHVDKLYMKMASIESIGVCSLDFETSASSANSNRQEGVTASELTLQSESMALSSAASGLHQEECLYENGHDEPAGKEKSKPDENSHLTNGHSKDAMKECTVAEIKLPSYVSISCAINGYTNYSKFCRSRDSSPARAAFGKSSPSRNKLAEIDNELQFSSPNKLAGSEVKCVRSNSDNNGTFSNIYTESKQVIVSKQLQVPFRSTRKYMAAREIMIGTGKQSSEKKMKDSRHTCDTAENGHMHEEISLAQEVGDGGPKSLVQQRIESLYGGSVAEEVKVFSYRTSRRTDYYDQISGKTIKNGFVSKRSPSCPPQAAKGQTGSPPVFRHLTRDFREQLRGNLFPSSAAKVLDCSNKLKSRSIDEPDRRLPMTDNEPLIIDGAASNNFIAISNGHTVKESDEEIDKIASKPPPPPKPTSIANTIKPALLKDLILSPDIAEREGNKFVAIMEAEKASIKDGIKSLEIELQNADLPEDACGKIRAACGKANLLLSQKFEQFRDLCLKNINESPADPFYTTASDLAGFWDMVLLQVYDVKSTFNEIRILKENNWEEKVSPKPTPSQAKTRKTPTHGSSKSNPSTPKRSAKATELARARDEARKQLMAAKKRGRQQNVNPEEAEIAIFTPDSAS